MAKRYTVEFKQNILDLHNAGLKTARELSNEYGVGYSTIFKWCQAKMPDSKTGLTPDDYKVQAKRMKELEEENEILKKALGLFARK